MTTPGLVAFALAGAVASSWATASGQEPSAVSLRNIPEVPDSLREALALGRNHRSAELVGWAWDGSGVYIRTAFGEVEQLHRVEAPLGARRQLTFGPNPPVEPIPSPSADLVVFNRGRADNELAVHLLDASTGQVRQVSPPARLAQLPRWSRDGGYISWFSPSGNGHTAILRAPVKMVGNHEQVYWAMGIWAALDWARDGTRALLYHYVSDQRSELHVLNTITGAITRVDTASAGAFQEQTARFSGDDRYVVYVSNQDNESAKLYGYNLHSGRTELLAASSAGIETFATSNDGAWLAYVSENEEQSLLHAVSLGGQRWWRRFELPPGRIGNLAFSPSGERLAFDLAGSASPSDVFVVDLARRDDTRVERWTESETGGAVASSPLNPVYFSYSGAAGPDGLPVRVPAFMYAPDGPGPHPVIVFLHGGPAGQARVFFSPMVQFWVRTVGVAVIFPNVRGSTGYGSAYTALDDGYGRNGAIDDVGALLDWIADQPTLDAHRVMTYGHSYGGYLSLMTAVRFGSRLVAAASAAGPTDLALLIEETEEGYKTETRSEYGDEREPEMRAFLQRVSPLTYAEELRLPIFIAHGGRDSRVTTNHSERMVNALIRAGNEPWYLFAADEGHIFNRKSAIHAYEESLTLFITMFLVNGSTR